jgi:hypothetical protein
VKRCLKGQSGYRDYHKKNELLKVLMGAVLIIIQLIFREFAYSTALTNTLTVMAILSVLPVANIAAPLLASFKYRSVSPIIVKNASAYEEKGVLLYDLIISSKEQLLPMDVILVMPDEVYAYCTAGKADSDKAERYIKRMLSQQKLDYNVKVIFDENSFFKRLSSLKSKEKNEEIGRSDQAVTLLKSLSM